MSVYKLTLANFSASKNTLSGTSSCLPLVTENEQKTPVSYIRKHKVSYIRGALNLVFYKSY